MALETLGLKPRAAMMDVHSLDNRRIVTPICETLRHDIARLPNGNIEILNHAVDTTRYIFLLSCLPNVWFYTRNLWFAGLRTDACAKCTLSRACGCSAGPRARTRRVARLAVFLATTRCVVLSRRTRLRRTTSDMQVLQWAVVATGGGTCTSTTGSCKTCRRWGGTATMALWSVCQSPLYMQTRAGLSV